ncbi:MAG: hypothetical protein LBU21_10265, partial [Treponema sp.]|nr:hypothetical protein [Treponema sp.]
MSESEIGFPGSAGSYLLVSFMNRRPGRSAVYGVFAGQSFGGGGGGGGRGPAGLGGAGGGTPGGGGG